MVIKKKKKVKGFGGGKNQFEGFKPNEDDLTNDHKEERKEEEDMFGWGRQNSDVTNFPPESTKMTEKLKPKLQPKKPADVKHQLLEDLKAKHNPSKPLL